MCKLIKILIFREGPPEIRPRYGSGPSSSRSCSTSAASSRHMPARSSSSAFSFSSPSASVSRAPKWRAKSKSYGWKVRKKIFFFSNRNLQNALMNKFDRSVWNWNPPSGRSKNLFSDFPNQSCAICEDSWSKIDLLPAEPKKLFFLCSLKHVLSLFSSQKT